LYGKEDQDDDDDDHKPVVEKAKPKKKLVSTKKSNKKEVNDEHASIKHESSDKDEKADEEVSSPKKEQSTTSKKLAAAKQLAAKKTPSKKTSTATNGEESMNFDEDNNEEGEEESEDESSNKNEDKHLQSIEQDTKITRLRKYLRAAGLRIVKNSELFELKSKKARYDYIKNIFKEAGYTSNSLSIKSCQKFKLKRENEKEIAELDVGNIIETAADSSSRPTRNSTRGCRVNSENAKKNPHVKLNKVDRSRIKQDESDSDENSDQSGKESSPKNNIDALSRIRHLVSSDEEDETDQKNKINKREHKIQESDEE
jgi:hypothetical protein